MAVQNNLVRQGAEPKSTAVINLDGYKRMINNTLGNPQKAARFVAAITSAVSTNPALAECDPSTIVSAGLLGEGLNLSPSPQLGQYFLVPFKDRKNNRTVCQFLLGYKGYIQLATRTGEYKRINAMPIKEGELVRYNPFDDEIVLEYIENYELRETLPTIGYYAMFEYHNGFRKVMYWSKDKMLAHADKYSAAFSAQGYKDLQDGKVNQRDMWKYSSFWYNDFDGMAFKTMLRQLISKWGLMSTDMQKAYEADGGIIGENGEITFADGVPNETAPDTAPIEYVEAESNEPTPEQPIQTETSFEDILGGYRYG